MQTGTRLVFRRMREIYEEYAWRDVLKHPAVVYIPYQAPPSPRHVARHLPYSAGIDRHPNMTGIDDLVL